MNLGMLGMATLAWVSLIVFARSLRAVDREHGAAGAAVVISLALFLFACGGGALPVVWPLLSGWGWLFLVSVGSLGYQVLNVGRKSERSFIVPGLATILFAMPAWVTRGEASLLTGAIPLGAEGGCKVLLIVGVVVLAMRFLGANPVRARSSRGVVVYGLLFAGAILFSIPFFWLLLTSFKEERDMTNANGLVWIPKVTRMQKGFDPLSPLYETSYEDTTVQVEKRGVEAGGIRVSVVRPGALAGSSFVAPAGSLKEVPREMKVVTATVGGESVEALLLSEDGQGAHLQILSPESRKGEAATVGTESVEPVRYPGLLWKNYPDALDALPAEAQGGLGYLKNTLFLCLMSLIGTVTSCTLVAYGFARLRFPGRGLLFGVLLATMMLPGAVTMLPSFLIFRELGWVDSLAPIWAPTFFGSAFNIFLLRQFFLTLPRELEDAAKIDGCGHLRTLWSIMAPQIKPALVVVGIWTFIGAWNNFMGPLIYVSSSEKMTIAYAMQLFAGDKSNQPGLLMAFATMALAPVVLLFFVAQRAFVEGIALTGRTG